MGKLHSIVLLVAIVLSLQSGAQIAHHSHNSALRQAHKYFHQQAYSHALALYQKVWRDQPQNPQLKLRIADCFRFLEDPHSASFWYRQVAENSSHPPGEHWLHLAAVLCKLEKYEQARFWYSKYLQEFPEDQRAQVALTSLEEPWKWHDPQYQIFPLDFHSIKEAFSPALWGDKLVFIAAGRSGGLARKVAVWNESPYLDLFVAELNGSGTGPVHLMSKKINSVYHEGPACFYDQGKQVIFTRSASSKGENHQRNLQLFWSQQNMQGKWLKAQPLEINHRDYSIGHPTLDETSNTLYFVSDMPGGYGGTDIYQSRRINGKWQEPENLGPSINTSGDELFPTFNQGHLYYASNGLGGLGGLDIFRVKLNDSGNPENMGYPLNSSRDDFGLVWQNSAQGFLSSNRSGKDSIFKFSYGQAKK